MTFEMENFRKGVGAAVDPWGNFYETVLERVQSGVVLLNAEFNIQYVNQYCVEMFRTERQLLEGRSVGNLFPELDLDVVRKSLSERITLTIEELPVRIEDKEYLLKVDVSPFVVLGQSVGTIITFHDYSEASRMQSDVMHAEKMAVIGSMAAGTVHEIRNPLTTVKGFLQLFERDIQKFSGMGLVQRGFTDKAKYVFPLLFSEIHKIEQILSDFLLISQPQTIRYSVIRINDLLQMVLPRLQEQVMQHNTSLICEFPRKNIKFFADPEELFSVLNHLVTNSIESIQTESGEIRLAVEVLQDKFLISVSDNGSGMPSEVEHTAFDPFVTTKIDHPGLGLSICRQVISRIGGSIRIASHPNKGTVVEMEIPFLQDDIVSIDEFRPVLKEAAYH